MLRLLFFSMMLLFSSKSLAQKHALWTNLLQKHVSSEGKVNYPGFKNDLTLLDKYLDQLRKTEPAKLGTLEEKAFWLNVYNAFMIRKVLDHYPISSVNDIGTDDLKVWDIPFIRINNKTYSLNQVENEILRKKFKDPRIHFGLNCASKSCPKLFNKAFESTNVEVSLDMLTAIFINDPARNSITVSRAVLSPIFHWYADDFSMETELFEFINKFSKTRIYAITKIAYTEYDWSLNE